MKSRASAFRDAPEDKGTIVVDAEPYLSAIVESLSDSIVGINLTGRITTWNREAANVLGYTKDEIMGRSIMQLIPPSFHRDEVEILRRLAAGEAISPRETTWVRKDGGRVDVALTIYAVRDGNGRITGAANVVRDLAELRGRDESRYRLGAIIDSADDAIVSKNLDGIVTSWNQAAARIFGYTADEMLGQPIRRIIPANLQHEEDEILRRLRAGERIDHFETVRMKKSGEPIEVSVTISPIRDEYGRVIAASKIARDISDRKRIERLLIQSEKLAATGRLAATIAHEINNPLESLTNLIYLARQSCNVGDETYQHLVSAEAELERVAHIARQTLAFYRDNSSPADFYLHDLVQNVLRVYRSRLQSANIAVDTRFDDLQKIVVSKGEMLQVVSNLICNSIDAMPRGGLLYISIRKVVAATGDGLQMVIRDNGIGIKQEDLERIFEPFFTTKGDRGTGLGLWVARQLVEKRGGQISVASSTEKGNSGTSTTICVPYAAPTDQHAERQL